MIEVIVFWIIASAIAIGILVYPSMVKFRRDRLMAKPFPSYWLTIVEQNLAIYPKLSLIQQKQLQGNIRVFLAEKQFIGCLGLQVTEEMKVIIAAIACLLLFGERGKYFPELHSILVYPNAYWVNETVTTENYTIEERRSNRLGESWTNGQLILAWDRVKSDTRNWQDGHNVVLHEFAHQLDQENGGMEGVPILSREVDYAIWSKVMTEAYLSLCKDVKLGAKTVIDSYGASNPVEFFAVATETFFEKPNQLRKKHEALYDLLKHHYKLDPVQWI